MLDPLALKDLSHSTFGSGSLQNRSPRGIPVNFPIGHTYTVRDQIGQEREGNITRMTKFVYAVHHLDPELENWSALEYSTIASECSEAEARFMLCSVPSRLELPDLLKYAPGLQVEQLGVEALFADRKNRVCLLDPAASTDLNPTDGDAFDIFVFGGILGSSCSRDDRLA